MQTRVAELKQTRSKRLEIDADKALLALQQIIDMNPDAVEKLRYADKLKAIELALRHLNLLTSDTAMQVNAQLNVGDTDIAGRIIRARRRVGLAPQVEDLTPIESGER